MPWLVAPSLEASVELSVRKLALDRRRNSLRNVGAMVVHGSERRGVSWPGMVCDSAGVALSLPVVLSLSFNETRYSRTWFQRW